MSNTAHISRILKIPIKSMDIDDAIIWRDDNSRANSAKNEYKWLLKDSFTQPPIFLNFYNNLWKLHVANKIKINLWRFFQNYISTFSNLQGKRLQVSNTCSLCRISEESMMQLLCECSITKQILHSVGVSLDLNSHVQEWKTRLANSFINMDQNKKIYFSITCWAI